MSKLNKLVTNYPVSLSEEEIENLSATLAPVVAACGGGSGGTGGKIYTGIGFVSVNNTTNQIGLTNEANTKLNQDIPSAVSSFPDSVQYAKKTYVDNTFQTKSDMSEYLTTNDASTTYQTKEDMSAYYYKTETSSKAQLTLELNKIAQQVNMKEPKIFYGYDENDAISSINSHKLAGAGGITGDYYSASNPSGFINSTQAETQILEKHYLTEASGNARYIPIPEGLSDNQYYAYTTSSWKVIQGAGDVSGISTVAHDDTLTGNGNNENLGVDITKIQTKLTDAQIQNITDVTTLKTASSTWNNVSAKLNTTDFNTYTATTAPSTYQPLGNYLSSNALEGYATQDWVGQQGYIKQETDWTNTIQEASAKAYNDATANANSLYQAKGDYVKNTDIGLDSNNKVTAISGKELIITAHQSLTNYYTKSETSGATQLSTEFGKYLTTAQYNIDSATFLTGVTTGTGLSGTGLSNSPLGVDTTAAIYFTNGSAKSAISAGSATNAVSADKAASASASKRLQDSTSGPVIQVGDVTALQNWASSNSSTWDSVSAKLGTAQYALDSATFVTSSNSTITGTKQYALTTDGWASVETAYLPLTGGTVTGQMTLTGTSWDNRLTIGRSNTAIDIGVALNGALTLKANANNACQFNMMQTGTSGVDINITYGQTPSAIGNLYVMKTHTIAEATTASGSWNGDNLLHIILDS